MNADRQRQSGVSASVAGKASRAVLWNLLFVPALAALSVLGTAVVARSLSIDDYAVYGLAMATVTSLLLCSDLGITSAVARFTPEIRKMGRQSTRRFLRTAAWSRIAALGLVVLGLVAARGFAPLADALPFHGASLVLVLAVAAFQSVSRVKQYYAGLLDGKRSIGFVAGLVQSALVILAVAGGYSVPDLVAMAPSSLIELGLLQHHPAARRAGGAGRGRRQEFRSAQTRRRAFRGVVRGEARDYVNVSFVIFLLTCLRSRAGRGDVHHRRGFTFRVVSLLDSFAGIPFRYSALGPTAAARSAVALRLTSPSCSCSSSRPRDCWQRCPRRGPLLYSVGTRKRFRFSPCSCRFCSSVHRLFRSWRR
jgi:hypothetical protein